MKTLTIVILVITLVSLISYDIYAVIKFGYQGTISYTLWTGAKEYPVIPLGIGILLGHLFWSQTS